MHRFILGAVCLGFALAGLFFLRFWRDKRDRLFLLFSLAFFVLAANRAGFMITSLPYIKGDALYWVKGDALYWVRFLAFLLILAAILDKNRSRKSPGA